MSSSFPKSDSTTTLLKPAAPRRPPRTPERPAENRRVQHQHQRPEPEEESSWAAECDLSSRRPLCQPSHVDSPDAAARGKTKPLGPQNHRAPDPPGSGEASRGVRERCRSSKPPHRHHHHHHHHHHRRKHHREDSLAATEAEPGRCPGNPDSGPGAASLYTSDQRVRKGAAPAENGCARVGSPSPSSCTLVPLSHRSSRRSRRSSTASSASDINLRTILNSLFGQIAADAVQLAVLSSSGFMGLVGSRVYVPLDMQTDGLSEESSWSFLLPLFGVKDCLDWPLAAVGCVIFSPPTCSSVLMNFA
ncbi:unnamed protein product [Tetraodon nigroviridis]|uniref:Chromosome 12 SCAF14692, whole genome shotgun sequence n=1 Tax=Tetraodon nigroviridis TaxID=99883 RepID=Q4SA19_TETNG|nr:unnamed protein product [Tetraodon nigroviridis]